MDRTAADSLHRVAPVLWAVASHETSAYDRPPNELVRPVKRWLRSKFRFKKVQNDLMDQLGLWHLIKEDFRTHRRDITLPGFQAMAVYRFGVWSRSSKRRYAFRAFFGSIHFVLFCYIRNFYGIEIKYTAKLGRRVIFGHQGGIVIHNFCTLGDGCIIRQNVTIGIGGLSRERSGWTKGPIIGKNVDFGAGAVVIGNVEIGDNVNIGPNSVILSNVKSNMTVMAAPSRSIQRPEGAKPEGSQEFTDSDSA